MTVRNREAERRAVELMRAAVFAWYGEACACCGAADDLGVDHINGDGAEHRAEVYGDPRRAGYNPARLYRWIIEHGFPDGFQTMCKPCNSSKAGGDRCRLDHGKDQATRRREANAKAQAAWRARNSSGRVVSTRAGTAGGRILAWLDEHGPSSQGAIVSGLGLPYSSAAVTLTGLLREGHVARPAHGVYCLPEQASRAARQERVYHGRGQRGTETAGQDWAAGTTWTTRDAGDVSDLG